MASLNQNPSLEPLAGFIQQQTALFEDRFLAARHAPSYKSVHDLRLATRRLRAALWLLSRDFPRRRFLRHSLKRLDKHLGRLRELDVALRDSRRSQLPTLSLAQQRRVEKKRVSRELEGPHGQKLFSVLKKWEKEAPSGTVRPAADKLKKLRRRLNACIRLPLQDPANIHRLRIELKHVRYALEALGRPTAPLASLQETLGKFHDREVLGKLQGEPAKSGEVSRVDIARLNHARKIALEFSRRQIERLEASPSRAT